MVTLKKATFLRGNDYSFIEKKARAKKIKLTKKRYKKIPLWLKEEVSVVLPCHNVQRSLAKTLKAFEAQIYRKFEVIVVDDGSTQNLKKVIEKAKVTYDLRYIKNKKNRDRSFARNTGISLAKGTTIVITDPDMVPDKFYLLNLAIRQAVTKDCVFLAFKEHLDYNDKRINDKLILSGKIKPSFKKDWRWKRYYDSSITPPNVSLKKEGESRTLRIIKETKDLKKLGKNKIICAWDLPSLVVGHGICFKKKDCISAGGFAEEFKGWGHDDIAFGIRMIARDFYIIPCTSARAYHINHAPHSGSSKKKMREFYENVERYIKYIETDLKKLKFTKKRIILEKRNKNKFYYKGP